MNLIGNDFSECNKMLKQLPYRNISFDKEKDEFIYNNCVHPEWNSDILKFLDLQVEERLDNNMHNLRKIEEYIEFRKEKKKTTKRPILIKKYFQLRMKYLKKMKEEIKKYQKLNKEYKNRKIKQEL